LRQFIIAESESDFTSHAGLGLIGQALDRHTDLADDTGAVSALRSDAMPHRDMLACYVGLLCLGKTDFEAITGFREDVFFHEALGVKPATSKGGTAPTHDANAGAYRRVITDASPSTPSARASQVSGPRWLHTHGRLPRT
jgi:hypothetical protein